MYSTGESSMKKIAEEMIDIALDRGSRDNISAIVARLPGGMVYGLWCVWCMIIDIILEIYLIIFFTFFSYFGSRFQRGN
ncbi:hypothetical protein EON63_10680 [archaeon]|nr:MAG: hypothetical protein EON63_10680 [archaeon]